VNVEENSDEEMGSVAGFISRGVPGEGSESRNDSLHGVTAGSMGAVAEEAPTADRD
jgi:hypothetical protein